jgi:predicted ATPase/class 3 adenylate cyclase/DNA-binding SARP family transcriptional activator
VKFLVLGPLEVLDGDTPVRLGGVKQRRLLAVLLVHANTVVSVDRLVDILWGDEPPVDAAATLQNYVPRLRATLEPGRAAGDPGTVLLTCPPGYLLHADQDQVDASDFERLVAEAQCRAAEDEPARAAAMLAEALGLWRGGAFAEFADEDFARGEAVRLEELRLVALEDRIESHLSLGRHAEAIGELEALIARYPLRERLRAQLMLALYRCGRQGDALRAYQALARDLGEELGITPSPELVRLEEAVLLQKPELDWQPPELVGGSAAHGLPGGVVTFLFTDIEGSTRLWDEQPDAMLDALARHDHIVREAIEGHRGQVVKSMGDGMVAVFGGAADALGAAVAAQCAVSMEPWEVTEPLRVRMGLHTGEAQPRQGDYVGPALNRAERIMSAGHGGQVLCSAATEALVRDALPEAVGLDDLGEHRLRGLSRPETIFQVRHPDLAGEFAPLRSLDAFGGNVPLPVSSFIGRQPELARVVAALGESRVVTLTGVGGVGKTRLALHAAGDVLGGFRDGAWWCELAPVRDRDGVAEAVAGVFAVTPRPGQTFQEALVEFLRHKELLLVLDNCEHLLESAAHLVTTLEWSCARLVVLATSREGLGVDGERILPTAPLAAPPADSTLETIAETDAVRLFVERAAAAADFALSEENAAAVAQVCRRLDGVPLAIELAAARIPAMTAAELAQRLDRRFQVLAGGRRGAVERHQTLRAAIDWSYELLNEPERRLLARLTVFPSGCTLDAAEGVCGGDGIEPDIVFECLANLVARSLVIAEEHGPQTRYRLLETIRQYGEERLGKTEDTDTLRVRHARHYTAFVEHGFRQLDGREHASWVGHLNAERDNLHAAWSWAIDVDDVDVAFRILCSAPRGHEGGYQLGLPGEAALTLSGAAEHPNYPLALAITAVDAASRGDQDTAEQRCTLALQTDQRLHTRPDWNVENLVWQARADSALIRGAFTDAAAFYEQAAEIGRANANLAVASLNLSFAAWARTIAGDALNAVPLAHEALTLARQIDRNYAIITGLLVLGTAVADTDPGHARACLTESLERSAELGYENANHLGLATVLTARLEDTPTTLEIASHTIRHLRWARQPAWLTPSLNVVAHALAATRPDAAAIIQGAAHAIATRTPETPVDLSMDPTPPNPTRTPGGYFVEVRRDTTRLLAAALGEERLGQLRAEGDAMGDDHAVAYTLDQIAEALNDANHRVE